MTRSLRQIFVLLAAPALLAPVMAMASPPLNADPSPKASNDLKARNDVSQPAGPKPEPRVDVGNHPSALKAQAQYGVSAPREMSDKNGTGEDPTRAAAEDFLHRAYPAADLPFSATLNAIAGFNQLQRNTAGQAPVGTWSLIGPSTANFPDILTFSGEEYTTSGRITALAIDPNCSTGSCRLWVAAAGGGIWRTTNALSSSGPSWQFVSGSFATNAIGSLIVDPTDASGNTLYAGTGEPNASGDSEAGMGLYKSTNGGNTWTQLAATVGPITTFSPGTGPNGTYTGNAFLGRSISSIVVDPANANHLYVSSARGVRGVSSVTGGVTSNPTTPRPPFGLFESTNGGATFRFIWDGGTPANTLGSAPTASIRGVNHVELDPGFNGGTNKTVYAAAFPGTAPGGGGVWRSTDGGTTWIQIKMALNSANNTDRAEFAVTKLPNGDTRMYVGVGNTGSPTPAHFYRSDLVQTGVPVFTDLTAAQVPAGQTINYCTGQCWYDNLVVTPKGHPDIVYLGGSYQYGEYGGKSNGRGVVLSTDAGMSFTDMTWDATTDPTPAGSCCQPNPISPNGLHPDQHALVVSPSDPSLFFEGSDGGLVRSSGGFSDISSQCTSPRMLTGADLLLCQQLLKRVPTQLISLNRGLSTLQFQSVSVAADNSKHVQGGTQDNGTFETYGSLTWPQEIYGDGGQSGFNAGNSYLRFNTFTGQANDANFQNGDPSKWVIISAPIISSPEGAQFYPPIIADPNPARAGSIFQGSQSVWRTQDWGGNKAYLEANCPEFTTSAAQPGCGDFVQIGPPGATDLTSAAYGATRTGCCMAAIARRAADTGTAWAATSTGRVFTSTNVNAPAATVVWTRIDNTAIPSPGRFITGIVVDPANANHAWISYSGYNFNTPAQPGHVFDVTWNPMTMMATWTNISYNLPDFPITALARDDVTGDLYAGSDFTVMRLPFGKTTWGIAGSGLPMVEVPGLTIVPSARVLYAATHGRSVWRLTLACESADGQGDMPGKNGGKASFSVHENDCNESGDSANFNDPSSGTAFQSTKVTSVAYDGVAHSVTMTGLGTNNGLPVAFTIVAVDSTLVPPGMFSITLSNAYTDSGNLLDGSITLH